MKVVLIEPRATQANVYSRMHMPLLGPIYLGTILKERGHEVEIYNEEIYAPDYSTLKADVIGISTLTSTAKRGYEIAKKFPKEKVILGGVHASLMPQEALLYGRQVVIGEAEDVICDVVEGKIKDPIVKGPAVKDLDKLPFPDYYLVKGLDVPNMFMSISTSRGCPFDCTFCTVTKLFGREYRFRSAENVMEELQSRTAKQYFFCDDNFTANPARARKLMNMMRKKKIRRWSCQVRCDAARDKDMLNLMAESGCGLVCVGFESINPKTLKDYNKKQTVEEIVDAINAFHSKGIGIHGMFVVGGDSDDASTAQEIADFAKKHGIGTLQMMVLTPLPGSKTYEDLDAQKRIFSKDWDLYDGQHVVFYPKLISAKELQLSVFNAYKTFYNVWRIIFAIVTFRGRMAFFGLMGLIIVKDWKKHNLPPTWIPDVTPESQKALPKK